MIWVEQYLGVSRLKQRRITPNHRIRTRLKVATPRLFWTTAVGAGGRLRDAVEHEQQPRVHPADRAVTVDEVIRGRRTLKGFTPEPVDPAVVDELLDLAVYAPNHHTTEPWRFVVVGPATIARLVSATDDAKLTRSATAIVVTQVVDADADTAREDYAACACAIQTLMLAARAREIASYWRTRNRS